ncbi:MAG: CRISPR-associated helicase Cas3', partial [Candidatus Caldatribacteriaceae bacterium]
PTGYGKTEFAFLWSSGEKFFYTLPLRAAVNQTHRRAENVWGKEDVALLHADADLFFLERENEGSSKTYDLSRQLSLPVCVATGDQFFPYALRPPGYERIYSTFAYARLVIDEVQAYEPQAAAIIVKFTEDIVKMGGRYLLMTATLPEFVKKEIQRRTNLDEQRCINLYEEEKEKFENIKRHVVTSLSGLTMELLVQKIIEEAEFDGGQRVLVVVNTVGKAQEVYENLCMALRKQSKSDLQEKIWLFHSRFTLKDRRERENILETEFANPKDAPDGAKILVATQVVEASLNIDADVLFTELAPMDALIQRMGRIFRRVGPQCNPCNSGEYVTPDGKRYRLSHEKPNVYLLVFSKEQDKSDIAPYLPEPMYATAWIFNQLFSGESLPDSVPEKLIDLSKSTGKKPKRSAKTTIDLKAGTKVLSEYEKFRLVSLLYQSITKADGEYLRVFYKTLALLDSGYVSSRKREAQEVFRKISDISAIPKENLPQFLQDVVKFFEDNRYQNRSRPTYTEFKRDILSRYLVNVPWEKGKVRSDVIDFLPNSFSPREKTLLVDWLQGVFVVSGSYDAQFGFRYQEETRV